MKRFILIASVVVVFSFASLRSAKADFCAACFDQGSNIYLACVAGGGSSGSCGDMAQAYRCACYAATGCSDGLLQTVCGAGGPN